MSKPNYKSNEKTTTPNPDEIPMTDQGEGQENEKPEIKKTKYQLHDKVLSDRHGNKKYYVIPAGQEVEEKIINDETILVSKTTGLELCYHENLISSDVDKLKLQLSNAE